MFTVPQLQALDVILKTISLEPNYPKLLPVVEYHGVLWQGDFVIESGFYIKQPYIDRLGDLEYQQTRIDAEGVHDAIKLVWDGYNHSPRKFFKIVSSGNLAYLHHELVSLIKNVTTGNESSVLHQYLYNAQSIDGKLSLPFINLTGEKLKLTSIRSIKL